MKSEDLWIIMIVFNCSRSTGECQQEGDNVLDKFHELKWAIITISGSNLSHVVYIPLLIKLTIPGQICFSV